MSGTATVERTPLAAVPFWRRPDALNRYGPWAGVAVLVVVAALASPNFLRPENVFNVLRQSSSLGIIAIGQTFVILTGGIDLSVGSQISLFAVLAAYIMNRQASMIVPALVACVGLGAVFGLINGLLITKRRVAPFIATLGMSIVITGGQLVWTNGAPKGDMPDLIRFLGRGGIGPIPAALVVFAILACAATFVLRRTAFGRRVYAVGGNVEAARLSGVNTDRVIISVYMLSGVMAALGGILLGGFIGVSDNWIGKGMELDSIAAVVIGGTSLFGGRGGVSGTAAGVILLTILFNLVLLLGLPVEVQLVVKGLVIIAAVTAYTSRRRA
jgi:ribose/xylose/arabinose/galactoside ABC-type transport system permease subunit